MRMVSSNRLSCRLLGKNQILNNDIKERVEKFDEYTSE